MELLTIIMKTRYVESYLRPLWYRDRQLFTIGSRSNESCIFGGFLRDEDHLIFFE